MTPTTTLANNQTPAIPQCGLIPPRIRRVKSETPHNDFWYNEPIQRDRHDNVVDLSVAFNHHDRP